MNANRWQQIDGLFQAAVEVEPVRRAAFLDEACSGDQTLRSEVESLLATDSREWDFIERPALEAAASLLADEQPQLAPSQTFGHYEIVELIGRGGMGEVYLAKDQGLNRRIALKLLPGDYTTDTNRLRRFQQEAQAASALNHPNILTIHELGEADGHQFIATEFVEGETLRQRMKRAELSISEALDVAIQTTSALTAAHHVGIIHRDIKPENIMLRPDGYVKVLDFGLAKLIWQDEQTPRAQLLDNPYISSGLLMGTVKYMSPEQAHGLPVDGRSDIFSLGIVLYEMLTGRVPFKGEAAGALINSILKDEPPKLQEYSPDVPEELQRIVSKSLCKDKEERYQTIQDFLTDLKGLKEDLGLESKLHRSAQPNGSRETVTTSDVQQAQTRRSIDTKSAASSIEHIISKITLHKAGATLTLAAFVIVVAGITFGLYKLSKLKKTAVPFQKMKVARLTTFGHASMPVISRDGKYVFYGREEGKKVSLWLRQIGTTSELQIVQPTEAEYGGAAFSPDGKYIYYSISPIQKARFAFAVYQIPVSGGIATKLLTNVAAGVSVSPDGKRFAYLHDDESRKEIALMTANADGTDERVILKRRPPGGLYLMVIPSWSPNGTSIACVGTSGDGYARVIEVNALSGTERPISSQKWTQVGGVVWLPDMSGLIVVARDESSSTKQVWHLSYPGGDAQRLTNDLGSYHSITVSSDGKALITEQVENQSRIWTVPIDPNNYSFIDMSLAKQISVNRVDGRAGLSLTPDGRIVYSSEEESGNVEIWIMDAGGGNRKRLTGNPHNNRVPTVSPDGKYIVFESDRTGDTFHIWRMDLDGGNLKQLTTGQAETRPCFSPDGKWVVYSSWESKQPTVWKVSVEGGAPTQITNTQSHTPVFSPDGKFIAYGYFGEKSQPRIALIASEGGQPIKTFDLPRGYLTLQWTPDGRALTYLLSLRSDVGNIWAQPIAGGPPQQLTNFTTDGLWYNTWSFDGKQIAFARGAQTRDVVLLSDLR